MAMIVGRDCYFLLQPWTAAKLILRHLTKFSWSMILQSNIPEVESLIFAFICLSLMILFLHVVPVHMDLNSADLNSDSEEDDTEIALMQQSSARAVAAVAMAGVSANVPGGYTMSMSSGASASSDPNMNQMQISMQHQHHAQQLTGPQLSPGLTPFSSLLEDIRNMELSPQATIEDFMLRCEQRRGNLMESINGHNKRAVMEFGSCECTFVMCLIWYLLARL